MSMTALLFVKDFKSESDFYALLTEPHDTEVECEVSATVTPALRWSNDPAEYPEVEDVAVKVIKLHYVAGQQLSPEVFWIDALLTQECIERLEDQFLQYHFDRLSDAWENEMERRADYRREEGHE